MTNKYSMNEVWVGRYGKRHHRGIEELSRWEQEAYNNPVHDALGWFTVENICIDEERALYIQVELNSSHAMFCYRTLNDPIPMQVTSACPLRPLMRTTVTESGEIVLRRVTEWTGHVRPYTEDRDFPYGLDQITG